MRRACSIRYAINHGITRGIMDYIIRGVRPDVWAKVKDKAAKDGMTIRAVVLALLEGYATRAVKVTGAQVKR